MTAEKATRGERTGLAVIALPCLVCATDLMLLDLAVPALGAELEPSSAQLPWIIDSCGFLITMGTLGDRIGRRRLLMVGAALVVLACMLTVCLLRRGSGAASTSTNRPAKEVP